LFGRGTSTLLERYAKYHSADSGACRMSQDVREYRQGSRPVDEP